LNYALFWKLVAALYFKGKDTPSWKCKFFKLRTEHEGGMVRAGDYIFLCRGNENHQLGTGFFVHYRIVSAVKKAVFVSDTMSYIVLRGRWCNIIVLNVHAPSEEKRDDSNDSSFEELEQVFFFKKSFS